ncbi:uncharacterized protein Dwil_GK28059 [Drosophila willistoni]|uniref:Uncharacterized protein n=1 Tax=Drosophila willistoni TaxID=7260 RepID=A0A0Q9WTA8_DROWI|nr:uncharacterized protein LOC26530061 [Drosophila willistoni]XP_023032378.1 uncharacterized protein LOC26530061 [Drosophila willistoni]XP_046866684.1 uncharacterized protein LOC26530061 [Drosophila willistoni]KRF98797.1 uncharacterized protein Dwil_GK28059 [Drosophila willistoni]
MTDTNLKAYNAFRRDLAKIHRTFNSYTQTEFTDDAATCTDSELQLIDEFSLQTDSDTTLKIKFPTYEMKSK